MPIITEGSYFTCTMTGDGKIHFPPNIDASSIIQVSLLPVGEKRTERCYAIIKRDGKECRCKHIALRGIYCGQHLTADKGEDALD